MASVFSDFEIGEILQSSIGVLGLGPSWKRRLKVRKRNKICHFCNKKAPFFPKPCSDSWFSLSIRPECSFCCQACFWKPSRSLRNIDVIHANQTKILTSVAFDYTETPFTYILRHECSADLSLPDSFSHRITWQLKHDDILPSFCSIMIKRVKQSYEVAKQCNKLHRNELTSESLEDSAY